MLSAETFASKYSHALDLIEGFKDFRKQKGNETAKFDSTQLAQTLVQSLPIAINGTTASLTLDKMGRIGWQALANSVNDKIPFTANQQADILNRVYETIYYLIGISPEIMAYGYHRGINECYAGTYSESFQIKEEHELEEHAAFQLHKAVV